MSLAVLGGLRSGAAGIAHVGLGGDGGLVDTA